MRKGILGFWERIAWNETNSALERGVGTALRPLGWLYGKGARLHAASAKPATLSRPVISVGNLSIGGSGKTPFTLYLAQQIQKRFGKRIAVVSRGFRKRNENQVTVVSDGKKILCSPDEGGDEAFMTACCLPECIVITGADRVAAATKAIDEHHAEVVLLDDGFQHYRLDRQRDMVMIDSARGLGNGRCFPAGPLREPVKGLCRADWLVIRGRQKNSGEPPVPTQFPNLSLSCQTRTLGIEIREDKLLCLDSKGEGQGRVPQRRVLETENAREHRWLLVSGIANPESFYQSIDALGLTEVNYLTFPDHYRYQREDWDRIFEIASQSQATGILTTEKDFWKLIYQTDLSVYGRLLKDLPLASLTLKVEMVEGETLFWEDMEKVVNQQV